MDDPADIPVVVLAGGRGARFDHESQVLPKPLIKVAGKPILEHIIDSLEQQGFRYFIVATGYLGWQIVNNFEHRDDYLCHGESYGDFIKRDTGTTVLIIDTGQDSHTGGRLAKLRPYLQNRFILTYGDGLSDVRMDDVISEHVRDYSIMSFTHTEDGRYIPHPAHTTPLVTLTAVNPPGRFGVLHFNGTYNRHVRTFCEKGNDEWINGGFMVMEPEFIDRYLIDENGNLGVNQLESEALPMASREWLVRAHKHDGYWRCMDTRRDLEQIEDDVRKNEGRFHWLMK